LLTLTDGIFLYVYVCTMYFGLNISVGLLLNYGLSIFQ